ncbi:uncharacterized protein LOC135160757 isoform X1 [Diachasmimorpha longicaudata]|uniref:uncharacterized protein LOC135160757 isoform X1 n=1 Tax=Diachasmimorpha longicaudata TaxID=58733 RepID=UPI0030B9018C
MAFSWVEGGGRPGVKGQVNQCMTRRIEGHFQVRVLKFTVTLDGEQALRQIDASGISPMAWFSNQGVRIVVWQEMYDISFDIEGYSVLDELISCVISGEVGKLMESLRGARRIFLALFGMNKLGVL